MNGVADHEPRARMVPVSGRGGAMAVLDFGPQDRPADIVFSHANGFNARTYRSILAPLAGELRILVPDLRGHGASTLPAGPGDWPGWPGFAADLAALVEAVAAGPVVLAGHSLGATSSLLAAGQAPERVRALALFEPVLLDGAGPGAEISAARLARSTLRRRAVFPDRAAALAAYRGRGAFEGWSEAMLADYVQAGFRETADGQIVLACAPRWEAATYARQDYDAAAALAAATCPLRILVAERGSTCEAEARAAAAGHGTPVTVVSGTDHFLPMQRPDVVREVLRQAARA